MWWVWPTGPSLWTMPWGQGTLKFADTSTGSTCNSQGLRGSFSQGPLRPGLFLPRSGVTSGAPHHVLERAHDHLESVFRAVGRTPLSLQGTPLDSWPAALKRKARALSNQAPCPL